MARLWGLLSSLQWWALVPDTDNRVHVGDLGDGQERADAAHTTNGDLAVVYVPTVWDIQVEPSRLVGSRVAAEWHDPGSGPVRVMVLHSIKSGASPTDRD
jgi:hypothetical protein